MQNIKNEIIEKALNMKIENIRCYSSVQDDVVSVQEYENLTKLVNAEGKTYKVWTDAIQMAINEHKTVIIPSSEDVYYIDSTIILKSNRRIVADKDVKILLVPGHKVMLMRNEHAKNGSFEKIDHSDEDFNISVSGGLWGDMTITSKRGAGTGGLFDENNSVLGASAGMFFNNIKNLSVENVSFENINCFSIQIGDAENAFFKNITFNNCHADGIHINGNTKCVYATDIKGEVEDDLVALNAWDWEASSANFGNIEYVYCENLFSYESSLYKAIRILPGKYTYKDGNTASCDIKNIVFKDVKGIKTVKMYMQTYPYEIGGKPGKFDLGHGDRMFFENFEMCLDAPIDLLKEYAESHPVKGTFAAFELGSYLNTISFENINVNGFDREKYPMGNIVCIGPKSVRTDKYEIFNPNVSSYINELYIKNFMVNGKKVENMKDYIKEIVFDDIYNDGDSSGKGEIRKIIEM